MFNWKHIKVLIAALLLSGCSLTPIAVTPEVYHPALPESYMTCEHIKWEYIIVDNKARPSLSYQHGLDLSQCRDDMIRYLKESTKIIKYYRKEKP